MSLLVLLTLPACGWSDWYDSSHFSPPPTSACGDIEKLAPKFMSLVRGPHFKGVQEVLTEQFGDNQALAPVLSFTVELLKELSPEDLDTLVTGLKNFEHGKDLERMILVFLKYIMGTLPGQTVDHYDVIYKIGLIFDRCDGKQNLVLLRCLLTHGRRDALLDSLVVLLEDPNVTELLKSLNIQGETGRNGFIALVKNIVDLILAPDFKFSDIEELLDSGLYSLIRLLGYQGLEEKIRLIVSEAGLLLEEDGCFLAPLRTLLACLKQNWIIEPLLGMLYDMLLTGDVDMAKLLTYFKDILELDQDKKVEKLLLDVIDRLEADDKILKAVSDLAANLLNRHNAPRILPFLAACVEAGVVEELFTLLSELARGCITVNYEEGIYD